MISEYIKAGNIYAAYDYLCVFICLRLPMCLSFIGSLVSGVSLYTEHVYW